MKKDKDFAIKIENLSKVFTIYKKPADMFREIFWHQKSHDEFCALDNINLQINKGEVMGIIGRNGAGKSTLLKIITGALDKTAGTIKINGKVSAILELGSGFHPEYTGRENIYNGGMILGMSKKEIDRKVNSIIKFSELEKFIDNPYKTYSDGMKTRLAFSVATAIEPDILVIDEALAAGDSFFVNKCIDRITKICRSGATVLLVSHNTFLLQRLCNRAVLLQNGKVIKEGDAVLVCQEYEFSITKELNKKLKVDNNATGKKVIGNGMVEIKKVTIFGKNKKERYNFTQGEDLIVKIVFSTKEPINNPGVYCLFTRGDGIYAASIYTGEPETNHDELKLGRFEGTNTVLIKWPNLQLGDGEYFASVGFLPELKKEDPNIFLNPYVIHDKCYKFNVKRPFRPLQTIFDQKVEVERID